MAVFKLHFGATNIPTLDMTQIMTCLTISNYQNKLLLLPLLLFLFLFGLVCAFRAHINHKCLKKFIKI